MGSKSKVWALVLAAGDGKRLESLTRTCGGAAIPKQYCSLRAGPSLLHDALRRALAVTTPERVCAVVARKHWRWWARQLQLLPRDNVIVQPENLGTGIGMLLPLVHILERDPHARMVILPSDHHVRAESTLVRSLRGALENLTSNEGRILLLGVTPEEPDPGFGYIVPEAASDAGGLLVREFVEKPSSIVASRLIQRGALWNTFIIAADIGALLRLYEIRAPGVIAAMRNAVRGDARTGGAGDAVRELYANLQPMDFSRDVLAGQEASIRLLPVPACGWSDLGTPERVARILAQVPTQNIPSRRKAWQRDSPGSALSLAEHHARQARLAFNNHRFMHAP
jgi:mannose-1-phosphate guanylyltransferase